MPGTINALDKFFERAPREPFSKTFLYLEHHKHSHIPTRFDTKPGNYTYPSAAICCTKIFYHRER